VSDLNQLRQSLQKVVGELRAAVNISMELRAGGEQNEKEVARAWEEFLGQFLGYVREKGRETGQNLFEGISFPRSK